MILVDSAIWDAAQYEKDKKHGLARDILLDVGKGIYGEIAVTDYIIDEVLTWMNVKVGHSDAVELSARFFEDPEIHIIKIDWAIIHKARNLFEEKNFLSFTDATTAVVMETNNIGKIATFDLDFKKLGFEVVGR